MANNPAGTKLGAASFLKELYETAAKADGNTEGFAKALADLCAARGIARREDFVPPDQQQQFFKDGKDPLAQRIIAFWSELDGPLKF
ncbi:MAG: hypothetical protein ACKOBP_07800 [Planctomycetia bacterium]